MRVEKPSVNLLIVFKCPPGEGGTVCQAGSTAVAHAYHYSRASSKGNTLAGKPFSTGQHRDSSSMCPAPSPGLRHEALGPPYGTVIISTLLNLPTCLHLSWEVLEVRVCACHRELLTYSNQYKLSQWFNKINETIN